MRRLVALLVLIIPYFALTQPTANFSSDIVSGCAPVLVRFTDQSVGAVQWEWQTGVGGSSQQNPSILYLNAGSYDVSLIVTDANGLKDTLTRNLYIQVHNDPTAQFQASITQVCAYQAVSFSDLSLAGSGNITSWQWDFGDGTLSSQSNPSHVYTQAGVYPVSLVIENQFGCMDEIILPNYITVQAPDPDFTVDETVACGPPLAVNFTSLTSTGTHQWTFGDGNTSSSTDPAHTYNQFGTFDVQHIVTDAQGCVDTLTKYDLISIGINTLGVSAHDSSVCIFDTVFFQSNAPSNSNIQWDFGDGDSSNLANPYHIYQNPGTYIATADISDGSGCQVSLQVPITVYGKPQIAISTLDTTVGCSLPFTVDFLNQTQGAISYTWNFGDGSQASFLQNPSHTYTREDTFHVSVQVVGPGGCLASKTFRDYVLVKELEAGFASDITEGCAPIDVQFTDTSRSPFPINSWTWNLGNGATSSLPDPNTTYTNPGSFDISLIVSNTQGCRDTVIRPAHVTAGLKPNVNFAIDTNRACAYGPINFTNLSTGANDFIWYFSDGDTAMSFNAQHGFGALGMMDVMLVGNDRGCRDTLVQNDIIEVLAPLPIMGISDRKICELPKVVTFSDLSVGADQTSWAINNSFVTNQRIWNQTFTQSGFYSVTMTVENFSTGCVITSGNAIQVETVEAKFEPDTNRSCIPFLVSFLDQSTNATKWTWHFDYGSDSSLVNNPTYSYREVGNYDPMLIVQNGLGCKDSFQYSSIHALGVEADFRIPSDSTGCVPLDVQFQDFSTGTGTITQWEWDMGDSSIYHIPNPTHTFNYQSFYSIKLKVTDEDGCVDSLTKSNQIYATQPIPDFLVNPPVNCSDKNSVFVSLSTGAGLTYQWDFGDGNASTLANPAHSYAQNGLYDVSLLITDVNGCDSSMTVNDAILISEVDATFTADTSFAACPPLTVNFEADTTFPHAGLTYRWDFGDGATSTDPLPSHIYTLPGQYTVSLILETPTGCSDTMTLQNMVTVLGPTASFNFNPTESCPGFPIDFQAQSTFDVTYDWIFGDGNTGNGQQSSHVYTTPGTYTPVLVIQDSAGCEVFHVSSEDLVIHQPPIADFFASDTAHCDSGAVSLNLNSQQSTPLAHILWYTELGDSSGLSSPSFYFNQMGDYSIGLQVEDQNGCRDTVEKQAFVHIYPSPHVSIQLIDTTGCIPMQVEASILLNGHPFSITQYDWSSPLGNGQDSTYSFVAQDSGNYLIDLRVTDENQCSDFKQLTATAYPLPVAAFVAADSFGCGPFQALFTDLSQGQIAVWNWTFGDGSQSQLQNPVHTYLIDGVYTVGLEVENIYGCRDDLAKRDYINLRHPLANFSVDPSVVCPNDPVSFLNLSQSDTSWLGFQWTLGDGSFSRDESPNHIYAQSGFYDVGLVAEDVFQCKDTFLLEDAVQVLEDIVPEVVEIDAISVINNREVSIEFEAFPNTRNDFGAYHILRQNRAGIFVSMAVIEDLSQTSYTDTLPDDRLLKEAQCYKIMVVNRCGTGYDPALAEAHCTIELSTLAGTEEVRVSWTPYVGWSRVRSYQLFRVNGYDPNDMIFLGEFGEEERQYLDLDMYCYDTYSYRVLATGPQPGLRSFSDTAFAAPEHLRPDKPSHILQVSVENDDFLQIDWELPEVEGAAEVVLERNDGNGFEEVLREDVQNQNKKHQDQQTLVHEQSYSYRIFTVDSCGDYTPQGYTGNSIHLRTHQSGSQVELNWNSYKGWPQGVENYVIEIRDPSTNSYRVLARMGGNDTSFVHKNPDRSNNENCYRITAEAAHSDETLSLSNKECQWLDPVMYYPNAFTPNDDGINDEFLPKGFFLEQYQMTIFDRWGKVLFVSTDIDLGWNGLNKAGLQVPEGVYVFQVNGIGKNGTSFSRTGTLSLVR